MSESPFRKIPPVQAILAEPILAGSIATLGRETVLQAVRSTLDALRLELTQGQGATTPIDPPALALRTLDALKADRPGLRPVINATGILLHTGLGRSPLAEEAIEAIEKVSRGYCNLEFDLDSGTRSRRTTGVAELIRRLTGAEAAAVVNNNAAATVLALKALAEGREVIVSRGQLVEIGGSFRLPEVFEASGAKLREVGTTNKTRLADYEKAIGPETAALLRVHSSNFRIVGFTEQAEITELAELAHSQGILALDDIGSSAIGPGRPPIVHSEPTILEGLAAGADLVMGSGDKLLGGPQCGLLIGRREVVRQIETHPLMRAFRVDKLTLAALEATLRLAIDPDLGGRRIPLWSFLNIPLEALQARAERLAEAIQTDLGWNAEAVPSTAFAGGGSAPDEAIPSFAVRLSPPFPEPNVSEGLLAAALRRGEPALVSRVQAGALWLDLRALRPEEDDQILVALRQTLRGLPMNRMPE